MPTLRNALAYLALVATAALAACATTPKEPDPAWRSAELTAPSRSVLWFMTASALERERYPVGSGVDPDSLEAESGWKTDLAPFSGDGVRRQAVVRYRPLGDGRWAVDVRVRRQRNMSLVRPTDPTYADWEWTADDVQAAALLLGRIRAALGPEIELSEPPVEDFGAR
jgi:hypothetical protein